MQTKLTLRLDRRLISQAKAYARRTGKSVSEVVADFFGRLHADDAPEPLSPVVRDLFGALRPGKQSEQDYRAYLESKHS